MLTPLPRDRWNFATAAHLARRAAFGGTPAELEALANGSPAQAVQRLWGTSGETTPFRPEWAKPDPDRAERLKAYRTAPAEERQKLQRERNQVERARLLELQHGWLQRMADPATAATEKLTLFWHGHFATSATKIRDTYLMWRQNDLFRRLGGGEWPVLLDGVTRDPAMLLWLDQAQSRKDRPNENYARELLELFALGEGHYTEADVTSAARALTGLTLDRLTQEPVFRQRLHDPSPKTFLGETGRLDVDDVLRLVVRNPQADRHLTERLWRFYAGVPPTPELHAKLAESFRQHGRRTAPWLHEVFQSEAFYSPAVMRQQIKSPVDLLVGACRQLERPLPPAPACANALRLLGQEPFLPPNVKGWDGGIAWINTNTLLHRHNLALLLVTGQNPLPTAGRPAAAASPAGLRRANAQRRTGGPAHPDRLFTPADRKSVDSLLQATARRFLQSPLKPGDQDALCAYLEGQDLTDDDTVRGLLRLTLCTADYQLA